MTHGRDASLRLLKLINGDRRGPGISRAPTFVRSDFNLQNQPCDCEFQVEKAPTTVRTTRKAAHVKLKRFNYFNWILLDHFNDAFVALHGRVGATEALPPPG